MVETNMSWKSGSDSHYVLFTNQTTDGITVNKKKEPKQDDKLIVVQT